MVGYVLCVVSEGEGPTGFFFFFFNICSSLICFAMRMLTEAVGVYRSTVDLRRKGGISVSAWGCKCHIE